MGRRIVRPYNTTQAPEGKKWCPHCMDFVSTILFRKNRSAYDGLSFYCNHHQYLAEVRSKAKAKKQKPPITGLFKGVEI